MTYPPATIARRLACGVCPLCGDPGKPVAARHGIAHELATVACLEHLLDALGAPVQPPAPAFAPPDPAEVRRAFRATLRRPVGHDSSPTAVTLARQAPPTPLESEALAAALECMRQLGAVPLRNEPTYGTPIAMGCPWKPPTAKTVREYDEGRPFAWSALGEPDNCHVGPPGLEVPLDDEGVPSGARTLGRAALKAGWAVRVKVGPSTTVFTAERARLRVLAVYEKGRFSSGHLRQGQGQPVACTAKQVETILKGA